MVSDSENLTVDKIKNKISIYLEENRNKFFVNLDDAAEKYNTIVGLFYNSEPSLNDLEKIEFIEPLNNIYMDIAGHFAILKTIDLFNSAYLLIDGNSLDKEEYNLILDDLKKSRGNIATADVSKISKESILPLKSIYDDKLIGYIEKIVKTNRIDKGVNKEVFEMLIKLSGSF